MKKIPIILLCIFMLAGCASWGELADTPNYQTMAYFGGRGVCVAIDAITPESIPDLERRYDEFMALTAAQDIIEPEQSMELYNDLVLILARQVDDPYALLNDLSFIMGQYGAQFTGEGPDMKMTGIQPIPRNLYLAFAKGWTASMWMIENMDN